MGEGAACGSERSERGGELRREVSPLSCSDGDDDRRGCKCGAMVPCRAVQGRGQRWAEAEQMAEGRVAMGGEVL